MSSHIQGYLCVAFEWLLKLASYFCTDYFVHLYSDWNLAIDVWSGLGEDFRAFHRVVWN